MGERFEKIYVGITDTEWLRIIKEKNNNRDVNFWTPSDNEFKTLNPGELFLFKLHNRKAKGENGEIVGGGIFKQYLRMTPTEAWEQFKYGNGATKFEDFNARIVSYQNRNNMKSYRNIGCIILRDVFFLPENNWIASPEDLSRSIVKGKSYICYDGIGKRLKETVVPYQVDEIERQCRKIKEHLSVGLLTIEDLRQLKNNYSFGASYNYDQAMQELLMAIARLEKRGELIIDNDNVKEKNERTKPIYVNTSRFEGKKLKKYNDTLIEDIFFRSKYRLFLEHCKKNNILYMSELDHFDFYLLYDIQGLGSRMIDEIIKMYEENSGKSFYERYSDNIFEYINDKLDKEEITYLEKFGMEHDFIHKLYMCGYFFIGDLKEVKEYEFKRRLGCAGTEHLKDIVKKAHEASLQSAM